MCSFITQHNATLLYYYILCRKFWGSLQLACWLQECPPELLPRELNVHFSTISRLQRHFRAFGSTFDRSHNRRPPVTTPAQDLHIQHLQDRLRQPPGQLLQQSVCITKEYLHKLSETISGKLICMFIILIGVSTWLQFVTITILSGQMLTFNGVWHFGEVFSSQINPGFHCTGRWQTACMASCGWAVCWCHCCGSSGPWWAVGLWYGQAYVMDNEHRCILLMAFWMHRDTVTRFRGPLLCHSSTTTTSCCSMIMHSPMLQGSVHNSWKLKTSQFLHGQHTHRTRHPLSMFGMVWIGVYDSMFQFLPISNILPIEEEWTTFHNQYPDQLSAKEMCCTAWGKWWSHPDGFLGPPWTPPIQ